MEASEVVAYMFFLCAFATLLQHPASPVRQSIVSDFSRRVLMGVAMGVTVNAIIMSPAGQQSGGHFDPAITFTFYRLGKVRVWDTLFYATAQFSGAISGVVIASYVLRGAPGNQAVRYAVTAPGVCGSLGAFIAEMAISFVLMITVLFISNHGTLARYTPYFIGALYATYITFESPLSGMSMNPARTFGSAFQASYWHALWIYFVAPQLGMLAAAEVFLRVRGGVGPYCAKLHHANNKRCIFIHSQGKPPWATIVKSEGAVSSPRRDETRRHLESVFNSVDDCTCRLFSHEGAHANDSRQGGSRMKNMETVSSAQSPNKRAQLEEYDLVILGDGTGSTLSAWTFASRGQRVAVIERQYIGGSCPNIACLPSKNIIHSAKVASYVRESKKFGIARDGFTIDMSAVRDHKRRMVSSLNEMYLENYRKSGAELIFGSGRFIGPRTLEAMLPDGTIRQLRGTNVIIGTGTHAKLEAIPGLAEAKPLTHIEALELGEIPEHLLVIGGGYVGIELSQATHRFGSRVTVIDRNARLMHREDEDVCEALTKLFEDDGIEVVLNARVKRVSGRSGQAVKILIEQNGVEKTLEGTHLLVAAGRTPNTENIGLELAGVERTDRGYIRVNERLQTTAPGVWAIGEVAGSPQFTHISADDFRVVRDNLTGGNHVTKGRLVPFCLFTDPELARIGLTETEAQERSVAYRLFKIPMEAVFRARTLSETRGFIKALVEKDSDHILGFTGFGVGAGEIMGAVQIAIIAGLPYTELREAILAHPTLIEGIGLLFSSAPSVPRLHVQPVERAA
jgi:pyruvate/2-oxoglutarate dehydrogenase complex dihydrolipoamide dehydrogenase (E3) component/glycerol uptake facilitator-like aquaporin